MKELSIEEKAKAYDEALERAKKWYNAPNVEKIPTYGNRVIEEIFPELAESEDEKIRKDLLNHLYAGANKKTIIADADDYKKWANWLEKQGDQKHVEWDESIIDETISLINKLASGYGENVNEPITFNGVKMINNIKERLRAIKPQLKQEWSKEDELCINYILGNCMNYAEAKGYVKSACNEELHQKAKDWLKSLRPQPKQEWSEEDENMRTKCAACIGYYYHDIMMTRKEYEEAHNWLESLKYRVLPQLVKEWSEEDEKCFNILISLVNNPSAEGMFDYHQINKHVFNNWIKSIKDRVHPQSKKEWNEEDEEHIKSILQRLEGMCQKGATFTRTRFAVSEDKDWLKSFRQKLSNVERNGKNWKPTEEQMKALEDAIRYGEEENIGILSLLYNDLKAL